MLYIYLPPSEQASNTSDYELYRDLKRHIYSSRLIEFRLLLYYRCLSARDLVLYTILPKD